MKIKRFLTLAVATLLASPILPAADGNPLSGSVKCEGRPVAGVCVSDGVNVVSTDAEGCFSLPYTENAGRFIFISTPSGYLSSVSGGKDCFFRRNDGKSARHDFVLTRNPMDDTRHRIVVTADPQISDSDDLVPLKERIEDIRRTAEASDCYCFGINLGDMVGWNHSLYPKIDRIFSRTGIQWRNVIGNHDMTNWGRSFESSTTDYENAYGPTYYSFNVGKVHYVVLNDNFFVGKDWYYIGYLEERQLAWLEKDLACISKGSEVVVCLHIPTVLYKVDEKAFSYPDIADLLCNNTALHKILKPYNTLILSGHMHTNSNVTIDKGLVEHNVGGLCGAWWCGDVCIDGCPPGYKVYDRDGAGLQWYYKSAGYPAEYQAKLYVNTTDWPGEVIAHVWDRDENWKVEYLEDGRKVRDMLSFTGVDPHAREMYTDISAYKINWITFFPTPNLYRTAYNPDAVRPSVRITDPFGRVAEYDIAGSAPQVKTE